MIKNIIIVVLAIAATFFAVLSNIKANEADKQKAIAIANLEQAEIHRRSAEKQATQFAAEAIREKNAADAARAQLEKCKGR